ncbi:MAG TPA: T9SS type A sorting domain-containing protein, partial [Saprospiraceae bacterium]|nr:T9SS type A sorting domain-containing protein [Saprospiraceae bacterium]
FDPNQNQYVGFKSGLVSLQDVNVNERFADDGILLVSWTSDESVILEPGQSLFSIEFRSELSTTFGQTVRICSDVLQAELYDPEFKEMDIRWGNKAILQQDEVVFGIPIPNPFVELTSIPMDVREEMNYTYKIFDINGALICQQTEHAVKGRNFIKVKRSQMPLAGIYTLRVEASGFAKSFKLVMMNQ